MKKNDLISPAKFLAPLIYTDPQVLRLVFQGKWRLPVLKELLQGPCRLSQLRRVIPHSSKKMLIDTLHALEGLGWVVRYEYDGRINGVEYSLEETDAERLRNLIAKLAPS